MNEHILLSGQLGDVLDRLGRVNGSLGTLDGLYTEKGELRTNVAAALISSVTDVPEEYESQLATELNLELVADLRLAQDVVEQARMQKTHLTYDDLVRALEFYLDNDKYIDLR